MALLAGSAASCLLSRMVASATTATCSALVCRLRTSAPVQQQSQQQQQQHSQQQQPTAQVGRLNHVAVAVPDLVQAAERYRSVLGAKVSAPQPVPEHGVTVVFVELPNTKIELLAPLGAASPIAKFLQRNPAGGIHHMCLEVADVHASLAALAPSMRVLDPVPKIGAHGNPVVFVHPKDNDGVLLELEEVGAQREGDGSSVGVGGSSSSSGGGGGGGGGGA